MSFFNKLFKTPAKQQTVLDDVQKIGRRLIVKGYRRIAAQHSCAPTSKTTDQKIMEIYSQVSKSFHNAAGRRSEQIPALFENYIVLKFLQVHEMLGEQGFQGHLQYEVEKYLTEGLRQDYKQELNLFDANCDDPEVKQLRKLQNSLLQRL
jgi:hypothetical protein